MNEPNRSTPNISGIAPAGTCVLAGIRVLDFGRYVAGPYCATLLGFLGAEVIRIERREGGEDRYIAPVADGGEGGVFFQTGCNKKSITLDPRKPEARELVARLAATADVVVANLPAAQMRSMGIDYETLRAVRPDIILTTQTAFGDRGPYAQRGGFDGVGQAMSGAMYISGEPGAPAKAAAPYVDFGTAVLCALGTVAALLHRTRSGEGQEVKGTLLGTALAVFGSHLAEQGATGINRAGSGNRVQTSAPSTVFPTRDGHVLIHVVGNGLYRRWAKLMGNEARWTDDPKYSSDESRGAHSESILEHMASWCAARTTADALAALDAAGLPAGPIYTPQQALDDPQVAAMNFLHAIADYPGLHRPVPVSGFPVQLCATPAAAPSRPPLLGEHTDTVLAELGYSPGDIAAFRASGVV
ncbi:MAG TPA: CoA transferase [Steroidobacteraceae bacterium]|nr:CoA transferase [Steroidobacteraceae bacterium]